MGRVSGIPLTVDSDFLRTMCVASATAIVQPIALLSVYPKRVKVLFGELSGTPDVIFELVMAPVLSDSLLGVDGLEWSFCIALKNAALRDLP